MAWYEDYVGRPWQAVPCPPQSYTCGELVRAVYRDRLGIDSAAILADALNLRSCIRAMQPARYGLRPLRVGEQPQEYDVVFLMRASMQDHVGIAVQTGDGLMVMHCQQGVGVTLDSVAELRGAGFRHMAWYRHEQLGGKQCPV